MTDIITERINEGMSALSSFAKSLSQLLSSLKTHGSILALIAIVIGLRIYSKWHNRI